MSSSEPHSAQVDTRGQPTDEAAADEDGLEQGTELRTFLFADIRGYTTYTARFGDQAAAHLVGRFSATVREVVEARQGVLLELRGDEALVVFVSARQALRAAIELQRRFDAESLPTGVGIGLDAGEAIPFRDGYRGTSLNVAARLCSVAAPGEILASETVIRLAAKLAGIAYANPRALRLKGLDQPVRAVSVLRTDQPRPRRRPLARPAIGRNPATVALLGLAVVLVAGSGFLVTRGLGGPAGSPRPSPRPLASPTPVPSLAAGVDTIDAAGLPAVAWIDPATNGVVGVLDGVDAAADAVYHDGFFWALDPQPRAIHQVDPATGEVEQAISIGFESGAFTVGDGRIFVSELDAFVHVFDIASGRELDQILVGGSEPGTGVNPLQVREPIWDLAYGDGSLWLASGWDGDVARIDPSTGETIARIRTRSPDISGIADGVAFGDGTVWALDSWTGQVLAIDPRSNGILRRTVLRPGIGPIVAGKGAAWVADGAAAAITQVDLLGNPRSVTVGAGVRALAFDAATDTVWATSYDSGTISSIDVLTGEPRTVSVGHGATTVAAHGGRVLAGFDRGPADVLAGVDGSVLRIATDERFAATDPAYGARSEARRQFDSATCAGLLRRRPDVAPDGSLLEPHVAASMPEVSADGRTYTFEVRDGFGFSPPANEPLTAEAFRSSIERAVKMHGIFDPAPFQLRDIEGVFAFRDGPAEHISGIQVDGDRLSFRITAPSQTFLERLSLPQFCPVPTSTLTVATGVNDRPIARAGPYYVIDQVPGELLVVARNPNYPEQRPSGFDAIAWFTEDSLGRAIARWERGELDVVAGAGPELRRGGRTDQQWGPLSPAAAAGGQLLHHRSTLELAVIAVNPSSEALRDPAARQAVALALDRPALSALWGAPTDELMPSAMPGLVDRDRFPLDGAHPEEARARLAGREPALRIAWPRASNCAECPALKAAVEQQLREVGISVRIDESDDPYLFSGGLDSGYDMSFGYVTLDFPDPAAWMERLLSEPGARDRPGMREAGFPIDWVPAEIEAERRRLADLTGRERFDAAFALAERVSSDLSLIPLSEFTYSHLISERVGCVAFRLGSAALDMVAACPA